MHAYGYDFRNLMTDYDGPGSNNDTTYRYDAVGRRITKNVNGTETAYVHDGLNTVAEYNGSNQLQRTYVTPGRSAWSRQRSKVSGEGQAKQPAEA